MAAKKNAKKTARKSAPKNTSKKVPAKIPAVEAGKVTPAPKRDDRMPAVGEVLKVTRGGKELTCKITVDGPVFNGKTYRTLSGAASAAAESVSLSQAQNGFVFWGISRPASRANPVDAINKLFAKIEGVLKGSSAEERQHAEAAVGFGVAHLEALLTPGKAKAAKAG